ncbi:hypothetical protein AAMO2058_001581500 [Amorphochlora amoebiformis]
MKLRALSLCIGLLLACVEAREGGIQYPEVNLDHVAGGTYASEYDASMNDHRFMQAHLVDNESQTTKDKSTQTQPGKLMPVTIVQANKGSGRFQAKNQDEDTQWVRKLSKSDTKHSPLGRLIKEEKRADLKPVRIVSGLSAPKQKPIME